MDIINSINSGFDLIKSALDFISQTKDLKHNEDLINVKNSLVDLKQIISDLKETILEKDEKIKELESFIKLEKVMEFRNGLYYLKETDEKTKLIDGTKTDWPYCPNCYDNEHKVIHLIDDKNGKWYCGVCKTGFRESADSKTPASSINGFNRGRNYGMAL
jgi:ribosomal protein L37AE/L43A